MSAVSFRSLKQCPDLYVEKKKKEEKKKELIRKYQHAVSYVAFQGKMIWYYDKNLRDK